MSQQHQHQIRCPKCSDTLDVNLYDAINVQTEPELREALMANRLNTVHCEGCDFTFRVDKSLLYHDPARNVMIYWIPVTEGSERRGEDEFRQTVQRMTGLIPDGTQLPHIHLVLSRAELVERIFLCEAGLNERVIEYMKYMIYTRNLSKLRPSESVLLFNAQDSTSDQLCFVVQQVDTKQFTSVVGYQREAYSALCEMFDRDDQTATLLELFPGPYISARALLLAEGKTVSKPDAAD